MISKVLTLVAFVIYAACAAWAMFGPPPSRMGASSGWVCAAVMLAIASARMR
jgi:hypothetical protein